jgi:hypothetical protein
MVLPDLDFSQPEEQEEEVNNPPTLLPNLNTPCACLVCDAVLLKTM